MEAEARYTFVGLVILGITAILLSFVLWITRYGDQSAMKSYTIYFHDASLSGLQVDSIVTMRGIKVGSVASLNIARRDIELVKVDIKVNDSTPVKIDTRAIIQRNLLTGLASIDLTGSSRDAPFLSISPDGEAHPVIPEGRSILGDLEDSIPQLLRRTGQMIEKANSFFTDENRELASRALKNLSEILAQLSDKNGEFAASFQEFQALMKDTRALTQTLRHQVDDVAGSVRASSQMMSVEADQISRNVNAATSSARTTFESYREPRTLLAGPHHETLGPGE